MPVNVQSDCFLLDTSIPATVTDKENDCLYGKQIINVVNNIDFANTMRVYFETIQQAVEWGQCHPNVTTATNLSSSMESTAYLGVFDKSSYGVYDDDNKFSNSKKYWHSESLRQQEFSTYNEALHFAKSGVASLKGISETTVPPMQTSVNWRQKI